MDLPQISMSIKYQPLALPTCNIKIELVYLIYVQFIFGPATFI